MESQFKIIAVRLLDSPNGTKKECLAKTKKLKRNTFYYLCDGYTITDDGIYETSGCLLPPDNLYNYDFPERNNSGNGKSNEGNPTTDRLMIHVCAIVGENGSGKSTVIEIIMRMINNLAASIIGELEINTSAEHLHYIDYLYAELYFLLDGIHHRLQIINKTVTVDSWQKEGWHNEYKSPPPKKNIFPTNDNIKDSYLKSFFYTLVSNSSLYAYNCLEFYQDWNSKTKIKKILSARKQKIEGNIDESDLCWLKGIFHKNDGYQTPIVLTPFRDNGNIDINVENELAIERLITLLLNCDEEGNTLFNVINGDIEAKKLSIVLGTEMVSIHNQKTDKWEKIKKYSNNFIILKLHLVDKVSKKIISKSRQLILKAWSDLFQIDLEANKTIKARKYYARVIDYITYKTIKISYTYKQYGYFYDNLEKASSPDAINKELLSELVTDLYKHPSHITSKLRQAFAYLFFGHLDEIQSTSLVEIKTLAKTIHQNLKDQESTIKALQTTDSNSLEPYVWQTVDFVPPPVFDVSIKLHRKNKEDKEIDFCMLSSGERQLTFSVSSFLYHLINLDSVSRSQELYPEDKRVAYKYINAIFEEIELYFHPDMQRIYLRNILDGLKQINLRHIKAVNLCFVTHSPFLLSDIPTSNILFLDKDGLPADKKNFDVKTYGANIHDILKKSFFLEHGAMGECAKESINRLIMILHFLRFYYINIYNQEIVLHFITDYPELFKKIINTNKTDEIKTIISHPDKEQIKQMINADALKKEFPSEWIRKQIGIIDEPIIKNKLEELYNSISHFIEEKIIIQERISKLQKEIETLQSQIDN